MKTKITLIALSFLFGSTALFGQCNEWIWPDDKATAEEKYVLHNDLVKNEQYAKAIAPHNWLLTNAPNLNKAIYINGENIYSSLADAEENEDRKNAYVDSLC
ncbi:MAG: hypothetical protein OEY51_10255 [Cyclobacteriaceae bacterium]|nr:hypothetical protein [Cyclobacteriaceae bacterium]